MTKLSLLRRAERGLGRDIARESSLDRLPDSIVSIPLVEIYQVGRQSVSVSLFFEVTSLTDRNYYQPVYFGEIEFGTLEDAESNFVTIFRSQLPTFGEILDTAYNRALAASSH